MKLDEIKKEIENLTQWEKKELIFSIIKDMAICEGVDTRSMVNILMGSIEEDNIESFIANHDVDDILCAIGNWAIGNYIKGL